MDKVLVLGVGNILFTDEGTGVRALELARERYVFPDNVTLLDGGTLGMGLMDALLSCDVVFVLDAVLGGGEPGSIYRLSGDDLRKSVSFRDSMHQTDLVDTLIYCDLMGHRPEAVVLGMEPVDYQTMGMELSPLAAERLPLVVDLLISELKARGVEARPRPSA
ncbi:MAG: HyaD/HybD family hydrogenase maturation endopeptidase [Desulfovibrionaceae bacterium]|nr:HyaD/HybD family hydrogenase maturation endopeptidase [Desulfovibrionaceae bacterium]